MSKRESRGPAPSVEDGLSIHLTEFLSTLATAGYTQATQRDKRRLVERFIQWAGGLELADEDLDETCVDTFLANPTRRHGKPRKMERATLHQFLEHLREVGVVPPRRGLEPSSADVLVQRYFEHLRTDRGLCDRSVAVYSPFVRKFVVAQRLPEHVASLDSSVIRRYLLDRSRDRSVSFAKLLTAALRSFLRFLFINGETASDLSVAVPPIRRWRLATVPPFLTSEEVEKVIAIPDRATATGCRAYAMLLLLARLGLRASEVAALELDDIRWDVGEIIVRGKGRNRDHLPLLDDVGQALVRYISDVRGPSSSRRVFLRLCAPHVGLSGPTAVCLVAREAVRRAGLLPIGRVGAHVFRHSLATRMLQRGASLAEISKVLRHRSIDTTQLYAKVEFDALRDVALPWPIAEVHP